MQQYLPDLYGGFKQAEENGRLRKLAQQTSEVMPQAISGDQGALKRLMGLNPNAGMKAQEYVTGQQKSAKDEFGRLSTAVASTKNPQLLGQWVQAGQAAGVLPREGAPDFNDPSEVAGAMKVAQEAAMAYGGAKQNESPAAIQELQYLLANPDARKLDMERRQAGWQPKVLTTDQGYAAFDPRTRGVQPLEYGQQPDIQQGGDQFGFLADAGATVTSGKRSPADNQRVGGVPNSYHLSGQARDILPPQNPQQAAFIRQQAAANGLEVIDEGDHWHLEPASRQGGGNRVMPAPKASDNKPSALQERLQIAQQMGATEDELRQIAIGREGAAAGAKPLPVAALRIVKDETDAANTAVQINSTIDRHLQNIESGKLEFGMVSNLLNQGKLAAGIGDQEARNFQEFKSDLEKLRNDSLRLNNGVQTDGDAQRAWNELVANLNDAGYVKQRLQTIRNLNERAARLRRENVEMVLSNYGRSEESAQREQAQGGGIDDLLGKYGVN